MYFIGFKDIATVNEHKGWHRKGRHEIKVYTDYKEMNNDNNECL